MKYALVQGTRICQFAATAEERFPVAAGLAWIAVADDTTTEDSFAAGGVVKQVAAPPVAAAIDGEVFLARLTDAELQNILNAANANVRLRRWIETLRMRGFVRPESETAKAAKAGLVQAGLLTAARADAVFAAS